jgi:hypothetical protein
MSWKILGLALAAGVAFATVDARAMPLTHQLKAAVDDDVTAVRDGCGRGYRYSHRRGGCVPAGGYGPGPGVVVVPGISLGIAGPGHHHRRHYQERRHNW